MSSYDIIIVGGGTAGSVLAARLASAAPDWKILLLEAGPDNNEDPKVRTPALSRRMFGKPEYDWCFESIPQAGLNGRTISQTRGRMLGGSSAINSHSLVYPNWEMHDAWAELVNDQRWNWASMQPYYKKFQELVSCGNPNDDFVFQSNYGTSHMDGPVKASFPKELNRLQLAWMHAFKQLDAVASADPLSGRAIGGTTTTNAIDDRPGRGERSHAGRAYLEPATKATNLTVQTTSLVQEIIFSEKKKSGQKLHAAGVRYTSGSAQATALATREVILCAGVFGSPQLLELSGIGQRNVLEAAEVELMINLPGVGGMLYHACLST